MPSRDALVIMARYPEPGRVKTRLAAQIGATEACSLYVAFLKDLARRFSRGPASLFWAYTPAQADFSSLPWVKTGSFPQQGRSLGTRMYNAIKRLKAKGFAKIVVLGSDAPQVRRQTITRALAALDKHDVVLGPAVDGGYYLIGMRRSHDLFSHVSWSSPRVLSQSLKRARLIGLSVSMVEESFDVDEARDLSRLRQVIEKRKDLRQTAAVLKRLIR